MWICYLLYSLYSNNTYIGATSDFRRRLSQHNTGRGAKYTRGRMWLPILTLTFPTKNQCLSFEKGWQKLSKRRSNSRFLGYNLPYRYGKDPKWNRILDLLYFTREITFLNGKFKLNHQMKIPIILPPSIILDVSLEDWILSLPWPPYVSTNSTEKS